MAGAAKAEPVRHTGALGLCENSRRPSEAEIKRLFPFFERNTSQNIIGNKCLK